MALKSSQNAGVVRTYKVRGFDGVSGPDDKVLRKTGQKGEDYSTSIANEVYDLDLGVRGVAKLREGNRKISNTGYHADIQAIFGVSINGTLAYAEIFGGALQLTDLPRQHGPRVDEIGLTPATVFTSIVSEQPPVWVGEPEL
jgi:hypothetical protein